MIALFSLSSPLFLVVAVVAAVVVAVVVAAVVAIVVAVVIAAVAVIAHILQASSAVEFSVAFTQRDRFKTRCDNQFFAL